MDHIVITIRPPSDEALLTVSDAMRQVLDTLAVFEAAERSLGQPHSAFAWRLEKATTNSPFTVTALAEADNATVAISDHVTKVKAEVASGINELIERGTPPRWMEPSDITTLRNVFTRNQTGIGSTNIDLENGNVVSITPRRAEAGLRALAAINAAIDVLSDLQDREAYGEIEGVMLAAGRYRNKPAIQVRSELYGFFWCILSDALVAHWGSEQSMADVWEGKTLIVEGSLTYGVGGKLAKAEAVKIHERVDAPLVDLDSVLDPNFTAGLDPNEYLRRLHDGEIS